MSVQHIQTNQEPRFVSIPPYSRGNQCLVATSATFAFSALGFLARAWSQAGQGTVEANSEAMQWQTGAITALTCSIGALLWAMHRRGEQLAKVVLSDNYQTRRSVKRGRANATGAIQIERSELDQRMTQMEQRLERQIMAMETGLPHQVHSRPDLVININNPAPNSSIRLDSLPNENQAA